MNMSVTKVRLSLTKGPSVAQRIAVFLGVWRQRQTLDTLDQHLLDDIGVTRFEAKAEANRPIWDVPSHWQL